jgi:hypothetical protein
MYSVAEIFNFVLYFKVTEMQIIQILVILLSTNSVVESWSGIIIDGGAYNTNTQLYVAGNPPISMSSINFGLPHLDGQAVVMLNGSAYFTGGAHPITNNMTIFNPSTNTSTSGAPLNIERYRHAATVVNDTIIVCGGVNLLVTLSSCEQYNPLTQKWNMITSLPTPLAYFVMATLNNRAYTFGGSKVCVSTPPVYMFDGQNWINRSSIAGLLHDQHAGVAIDADRVLICGGYAYKGGPCDTVSDCFIYSASNDSWTQVASMAQIRCQHSMVMFEGKRSKNCLKKL